MISGLIRMPEFLKLLPPNDALALLLRNMPDIEQVFETINTAQALGRVTATDVCAPYPLPSFSRSTVDGYAVHAADTFGASESIPAYLHLIGEVLMGAAPPFKLTPAQTALIHTGGMLPDGANAVVMLEYTQYAGETEIEILRPVADCENVLKIGEDVAKGQVVLSKGSQLRPVEIGALMAIGHTQVEVVKKPHIGIISSGDEVISPGDIPQPGQVRDVNSNLLAALVEQVGGEPAQFGIVPDKLDAMKQAAASALVECDMVVISAGSSASARDMTAEAVDTLGEPGVLVHGVNVRPGKPTILAVCDGKPVIGLPGNPVSAYVIAKLFVVPVIEKLLGFSAGRPRPSMMAVLTINLPSQAGREDWIAVKLVDSPRGRLAEPIFGKSNLIFILSAADGLLRIPADATGLHAGEEVEVQIL